MSLSKSAIMEDIFHAAPSLISEDDCAENIVVPFLLRLGYEREQIRRKVTIIGVSGRRFKKQADLVLYAKGSPALVVETKRLRHRLREEDANQALSYAQLLSPPAPYAVLTNGHQWEVHRLFDDAIGGLEDIPEPDHLFAVVSNIAGITIEPERKQAAERLLVTLENKDQLEMAFRNCRQSLAKEGLIAESAFDELTKILVCKFAEEKKLAEGLGAYRFMSSWLIGEGPLAGLHKMFMDARKTFHVFPPNTQIRIHNNETAEEIVQALEPFGFYGFKTPLGLAGAGGDVVGSVYETFLTGTLRGDLGQYLTPRQLIEFMVELADIQIGERVLDLACGSGGFLIRAFLDVRKKIRSLTYPQKEKDRLMNDLILNHLWGIEINPRLATLCRINMILHGDGYEHIYTGDSIRDDVFENTDGRRIDLTAIEKEELPKFDVILMNPPFNLPYEDGGALNRYALGRGKTAQGSDYLMLERALSLLKEQNGRLLIIMPHGVASGTSESEIRDFVKSHSRVKGCISLPVGCFKPFGGSNARTCILLLTKTRSEGEKRFLAQAENVGYDVTTKYYREIDIDDLPEIVDYYRRIREGCGMTIEPLSTTPLAVIMDEAEAAEIETIDAGAAYTEYLHRQVGAFIEKPLGEFVDIISISINPRSSRYLDQTFDYVDLREVDDIYGQILKVRILKGAEIGSTKHRFQKWDLLFAKIMPSLANKKVAIVTQDVTNAIASTEFIVLRRKPDNDIGLFYLFRALRSDHFTRQAVANVSGATGRQRISPNRLLELRILVPPPELQEQIGKAVEQEFALRTLAAEQAKRADDEAAPILGPTTLRISKAASRAAVRRKHRSSI